MSSHWNLVSNIVPSNLMITNYVISTNCTQSANNTTSLTSSLNSIHLINILIRESDNIKYHSNKDTRKKYSPKSMRISNSN
jgi:hypothetical protein